MQRLVVSEYESGNKIKDLSLYLNMTEAQLNMLLKKADCRLKRQLNLKQDIICIDDMMFTVKGVAGIIKISKELEIEIIPKFLGVKHESWKDDFLELLFLTNSGSILYSERIVGGIYANNTLYDILASEFIRIFNQHKKYYIRQYRKNCFYEFGIEGEPDYEMIFENSPDGIYQYQTVFDKKNVYNAVILKAAEIVRGKVKHANNIVGLTNIISYLGKQVDEIPPYKIPLKPRDRRWETLYNASYEIVKNMSFSYVNNKVTYNAPGFVFSTWQIWEKLIEYSLKLGLTQYDVLVQKGWKFGNRTYLPSGNVEGLYVYPDISVMDKKTGNMVVLVDAKYKGRFEKEQFTVSSADIYEACAFCHATGCNKILLMFPRTGSDNIGLGNTELFVNVNIEKIEIIALKVEMKGLAFEGGLKKFTQEFSNNIRTYFEP